MTSSSGISSLVVRFETRASARMRLVCFAHAGGSASAFAIWHKQLPQHVELCAVQLPGRESRRNEAPQLDMQRLIDRLGEGLSGLDDRPLALFGHSLGGLVAFEYARWLRRHGRGAPHRLLVSAIRAPQQPRASAISHLPKAEFLREITRRYDGVPKPILDDPEMLEYFLPILRADLTLLESYGYVQEAPLNCPISAFGGVEDLRVPKNELDLWRAQTNREFQLQQFPGGHFYVTSARDALLRALSKLLIPQDDGSPAEHETDRAPAE